MSSEKFPVVTELDNSSKEQILGSIQTLLQAEHDFPMDKWNAQTHDNLSESGIKRFEARYERHLETLKKIEIDGKSFKILGWDIFQMDGERDTDSATIFTLLEGERVGIQELPNQHDVYLPSSNPSVNKGIYLFTRERFELSPSELPTYIATFLDDQESESGELMFRMYYPVVIDGQFPEMLDQVRRMNTREIMPLSEDIEIPF